MYNIICEDVEFDNKYIELAKTEPYVIVETGCSMITKNDFTTFRPNGRPDYQLIYIHKGKTEVYIDNKKRSLEQGHVILYKPNQKQHYTHCCNPGLVSYWVHFMGNHIEKTLKDLNINNLTITYIGVDDMLKRLFENMYNYYGLNNVESSTMTICTLLNVFAHLSSRLNSREPEKTNYYFKQLKPALDYIENNYSKNDTIKFFANLCSMSESNFSHIFPIVTGCSPKFFILNKRLLSAQSLLKNTDKTIKEVSFLTGFDNQLYFSRIFKKKFNISPSDYQKKYNLLKKR